jgi:hypothetical protein
LSSRTIVSNRTRSSGVRVIDIPLRIGQNRTMPHRKESPTGSSVRCYPPSRIPMVYP